MEKKKVIIAGPVAIAEISLLLVIKQSVNCRPAGGTLFFSGLKQPVSLVVNSESGRKAFDIGGNEVPIGKLVEEAPDLADALP
ncbi:MAG TPA: hypothetical protein VF366_08440 [Dehalococcoidia bacterium]|jgi:hypothetical protein